MSTFVVLTGFALMLLLPCAIAMMGSRDREDESVYSDRVVEPIAIARAAEAVKGETPAVAASPAPTLAPSVATPAVAATVVAATAVKEPARPAVHAPEPTAQAEIDPVLHNRTPRTHQARILRNEIEALMATAAAARAQADALAANARLAAAKAEAADAAACDAEDAAAAAIQAIRRAA